MSTSSSVNFLPLTDTDAVDLSRHALVEASAGTGKTYTVENLVVRLLKEEPELQLENILLVTFTEKATGELKLRIRRKIEQTLDRDMTLTPGVRGKLADALDRFDSAAITTIHGFCHTLLKEFPIETGSLFHQEVIDDKPLLEQLLKDRMRSDWPRTYGPRLKVLLDLAGFSNRPDRFVQAVINLALRLRFDRNHETLIPDPAELDLESLWRSAREAVLAVKALVGPPGDLVDRYQRLNINQRTKTAIVRDLVAPVLVAVERADDDHEWLAAFKAPIDVLVKRHSSGMRNLDRLVPEKWLKGGENLHECPNLKTLRDRLEDLAGLLSRLSHILTLDGAVQLRDDAEAAKMRNGWISYQDMLDRVAAFLTRSGDAAGVRRIRRRYQVAFVDEFQDTDGVQWQIFRSLFLDTDDGMGNRLFLIGDPKQAIYAFRGADVYTYLDARRRMKQLAADGLANLYALTVNWRSAADLVSGFNRLFVQEAWFGGGDENDPYHIGYAPSAPPPAELQPTIIRHDRSRRPALNVVDLTDANGHAQAKTLLAQFICREIRWLTGEGTIRIRSGDDPERPLHFGDMAVLVRSQSEFDTLEPLLIAGAIPYAYYRKPGLFQCREAHWLSIALKAIGSGEHREAMRLALLTPFFDIPAPSLTSWEELPREHAAQKLLDHWSAAAQRRRWGSLFQSMMEDSGIVLRRCTSPGWERTETNLLQLFDYLEAEACGRNLDIVGLAAHLDKLRLSSGPGGDADIHQIEDERNKVQILTMHVSKGLEFPVVFIAGGLTVRADEGLRVYHRVDPQRPERGCGKVFDLTAETGAEQAMKEELDENKRLYYVALTRSRIKLYMPYFPSAGNHPWIGPICRIVSPSIDQAGIHADDSSPDGGWHRVPAAQERTAHTAAAADPNPLRAPVIRLPEGDLLPAQTDFRDRKLSLESFSSILQRRAEKTPAAAGPLTSFDPAEKAAREADEPAGHPAATSGAAESVDALPGGVRMGSLFHHVFESIDFQSVVDGPADILDLDEVRQLVDSALALYRIERQWASRIAQVVADTLRMPIQLHGGSLVLGALPREHRRHEMEFYFPLTGRLAAGRGVPGCEVGNDPCGRMVLRGYIDLIFSWQGRYYIADWKSNRLTDGYHRAAMAHEMASAGYELQYRLYAIATLRWLKQLLGDRFIPQRHFGGALYFFIRGMDPEAQTGIFHVEPEHLLPLDSLEAAIQRQIAGR